ncbi:MAG: hypothetical protein ACJ8R9_16165 [Steroidobacteraceae bacterium]
MATAQLGIVEPKEWLSRTSLLLSRTRSPTLVRVDKAYAAYFSVRSEANKLTLHQALNDYLIEKGRHWEKVDRDKRSGGLMAYLHNITRPETLATNVLAKRIPESRHGLLYLWQNAEVKTQWAKIALEGALSIGSSTTGLLQASNYNPGEKLQGLGIIANNSAGDTAATVLGKGAPVAGNLAFGPQGEGVANRGPSPEMRAPIIKLGDLPNDPTVIQRAKRFFGDKFDTVYALISAKIKEIVQELALKFMRGGFIGTLGGLVVQLVNFVLGKILAHAAPFVGNAIVITQGICQAIIAAKDRISAYQQRGMFVIAPGHPAQIGKAIETQMNWAIGKGIYNAAKGAAYLGCNLASFGASALIDVIAASIEFVWKFLTRFFEGRWMSEWIISVRERTRNRSDWKEDPKDGVRRPRLVYDDEAFRSLFEQGCRASVCVPMMTLNSGISGDLMMFMKMFDDTGGILGQGTGQSSGGNKPSAGAQKQFDAASGYWTQLKEWGRNYLEGTGFTFTSTDPVARGLMWHAIKHHQGGPMSTGDKVLTFIAGA